MTVSSPLEYDVSITSSSSSCYWISLLLLFGFKSNDLTSGGREERDALPESSYTTLSGDRFS